MNEKDSCDISVIVPCYNYARFLPEALDSILTQTRPPSDILVVDDGSTDDTAHVCAAYVGRGQIRYLHKANGGVSSARNLGFRESVTSYLMFLDADDTLLPNALEHLWGAVEAHGNEPSIVFAASALCHSVGKCNDTRVPSVEDVTPYLGRRLAADTYELRPRVVERLARSSIMPLCSMVVSRAAHLAVGRWREDYRYNQDREFCLRLAASGAVVYVDRTLGCYRKHGSNITDPANWLRNHEEIARILEDVSSADWADMNLRRIARAQAGSNAYQIAQRYGDRAEFEQARKWMRVSLARRPLSLRGWCHLLGYAVRGWIRRGDKRRKADHASS